MTIYKTQVSGIYFIVVVSVLIIYCSVFAYKLAGQRVDYIKYTHYILYTISTLSNYIHFCLLVVAVLYLQCRFWYLIGVANSCFGTVSKNF